VIPTVVILSTIGIILYKRLSSKKALTSVSRTFTDLSKREKSSVDYELDAIDSEDIF
jgi:hypothetical protein